MVRYVAIRGKELDVERLGKRCVGLLGISSGWQESEQMRTD